MKIDPFSLFNIKIDFFISQEELILSYHEIMKKMHPDQYQTKPEKEFAIMKVVQINNAFEVLKDPIKRASIMLELADIHVMDIQTDINLLESLMVLQEMNDREQINKTFLLAQAEFNKAFHERNKEYLKKNFLIMKYLERLLSTPESSGISAYGSYN